MTYLKYIILGIIQGLTEPIPVSSSGHLLVFRNLFNPNMFNDLNFEIIANFGSFLAILFIFRKDVYKLLKDFFTYIFNKDSRIKEASKSNFMYCIYVIIATIPVGIVGILVKDKLETALNNLTIVGIAFLITSLFLFIVSSIKGKKEDKDVTLKDATIIGAVQAITVVPGISRSGTTLIASLFKGLKREAALKFSFILYFPISIATMGLSVYEIIKEGSLDNVFVPYSLGLIFAFLGTLVATTWLFKIVKKGKLWIFAIYCALLGLFTLFYF